MNLQSFIRSSGASSVTVGLAVPSQIFVPVRADGKRIVDNGGDTIAVCFTEAMASRMAELLNGDAGL